MDYSLLVGVKRRNFEVIDSSPNTPLTQAAVSRHEEHLLHQMSDKDKKKSGLAKPATTVPPPPPPLQGSPRTVQGLLASLRDPDGAMHAAVVEGQGTFYIGIIDILQEWNYDKWYERMVKKYIFRKDANGLSAMDPLNYRRRFYQRAVLDVFDGLGVEDADDADIFERYSQVLQPGEERETVDTVVSSLKGKVIIGHGSSRGSASSAVDVNGPLKDILRGSDVSPSEGGSEVQLQSLTSSNQSRDSMPNTPLGTDRRFQVKPMVK
jgi:hypothetical protein